MPALLSSTCLILAFQNTTVFGIAGRMATRQQPTSYGTVVKEKQTISLRNNKVDLNIKSLC